MDLFYNSKENNDQGADEADLVLWHPADLTTNARILVWRVCVQLMDYAYIYTRSICGMLKTNIKRIQLYWFPVIRTNITGRKILAGISYMHAYTIFHTCFYLIGDLFGAIFLV